MNLRKKIIADTSSPKIFKQVLSFVQNYRYIPKFSQIAKSEILVYHPQYNSVEKKNMNPHLATHVDNDQYAS